MKQRFISWEEHAGMVAEILRGIATRDSWHPDLIVGLSRGGLTTAVMISHYLSADLIPLSVSLRDAFMGPESNLWLPEEAAKGKNILIVDDINDTGSTLNWIKQDWESSVPNEDISQLWGKNIRIATLFDNEASKSELDIDYSAENINKASDDVWLVFPWENWWIQK